MTGENVIEELNPAQQKVGSGTSSRHLRDESEDGKRTSMEIAAGQGKRWGPWGAVVRGRAKEGGILGARALVPM